MKEIAVSNLLHFAEHTLQELSLGFMAAVYITRLTWLTRRKAGRERQAPTGIGSVSPRGAIAYSLANVAMPWAMESTRRKWLVYLQFVIFHLGVVAAIGLSFVIPYYPTLLTSSAVVLVLRISIGAACLVGLVRIVRRVANPYLRAISSPDDYFSLILLTVWFALAVLAVPNDLSGGEPSMLMFFFLTAFFLVYVPFSKISHYLYYPFTRYYLGKTLGRRGVIPIRKTSLAGKTGLTLPRQ
jgi:nitrate reductase gamma subunit